MLGYVAGGLSLVVLGAGLRLRKKYLQTTDLYRFSHARGPHLIKYLEWIFCRKGYTLSDIKYAADREVEVTLTKNSVVTMVQIRQQRSKVTRTTVEFLYKLALKHDCDWAMIISVAGFTRDAREAARRLGITLYGKHWLKQELKGCRLKFM